MSTNGESATLPRRVAGPARDAVLVFVRAPEVGRVKTRLAEEIGAERALRIYTALAERAVAEALRLRTAQVRVHYTPADAGRAVRGWLGEGPTYVAQADGDLGARMRVAFELAFVAGFERVVVIGSDLPQMDAALLEQAFRLLKEHPAVLGPAQDGGYYLLGLTRPRAELFEGIAWSTGLVLEQTLQRFSALDIRPAMLEMLADVDRAADLPPELGES